MTGPRRKANHPVKRSRPQAWRRLQAFSRLPGSRSLQMGVGLFLVVVVLAVVDIVCASSSTG